MNATEQAKELLRLHNAERARRGLAPVTPPYDFDDELQVSDWKFRFPPGEMAQRLADIEACRRGEKDLVTVQREAGRRVQKWRKEHPKEKWPDL